MMSRLINMIADCEDGTVKFCNRGKFFWIEVDHHKEGFYTSNVNWAGRGMYLAAEMLDVDLWPAFADHLKPVNVEAELAKLSSQPTLIPV